MTRYHVTVRNGLGVEVFAEDVDADGPGSAAFFGMAHADEALAGRVEVEDRDGRQWVIDVTARVQSRTAPRCTCPQWRPAHGRGEGCR
jgi:hypothetical protein